jgi:hypothetical protein
VEVGCDGTAAGVKTGGVGFEAAGVGIGVDLDPDA